jgi:peptidoglycan/LPS O-acetylase OafA/YrhL
MNHNTTLKIDSHLYKLDVVRGFAICFVFLLHCYMPFLNGPIEVTIDDGHAFANLIGKEWHLILLTITPLGYGWTGVQLFLVISGFLIHLSYLKNKNNTFDFKKFFIRRFFRIYPPYLIILLFLAFTYNRDILKNPEKLWDFLSHLFMTYNLSDKTFFSFNAAFWSLALELQLYILYPLFLYIRYKIGIHKLLFLLLAFYFIITIILHQAVLTDFYTSLQTFVLRNWVIWGLGAFLAERYFNGEQLFKVSGKILILFLLTVSITKLSIYSIKISDLLWAMFYVTMLNYYLNISRKIPLLWEKRLMDIGECSYSMYLVHQPIIGIFVGSISILGLSLTRPTFHILDGLGIFFIVYVFSKGYYHLVEKKSIEVGKMIIDKYF